MFRRIVACFLAFATPIFMMPASTWKGGDAADVVPCFTIFFFSRLVAVAIACCCYRRRPATTSLAMLPYRQFRRDDAIERRDDWYFTRLSHRFQYHGLHRALTIFENSPVELADFYRRPAAFGRTSPYRCRTCFSAASSSPAHAFYSWYSLRFAYHTASFRLYDAPTLCIEHVAAPAAAQLRQCHTSPDMPSTRRYAAKRQNACNAGDVGFLARAIIFLLSTSRRN